MTSKNFPQDYTLKSNPVDNDLLIIADSEDSNAMKKITIGSITADIGDGLIVDGSSSSTTTYSSDKINTLNATQDTALTTGLALKVAKAGDNMTGLFKEAQGANIASATTTDLSAATGNSVTITGTTTITGFGTVQAGTTMRLTFSGILTLTHNATSLILPNAGSNITTAAWDSGIFISLGSGNWKCLVYQRVDGTSLWGVSITSLTEDTGGDMDADFVLAYDNSASGNRKQKINVYRATQAEWYAGTSTTKFITPAILATELALVPNVLPSPVTYFTHSMRIDTDLGWSITGTPTLQGNWQSITAATNTRFTIPLWGRASGVNAEVSNLQWNSGIDFKMAYLFTNEETSAGTTPAGTGDIWYWHGFTPAATAWTLASTVADITDVSRRVWFAHYNGRIYAVTANGTNVETTDIQADAGYTKRHFMIDFTATSIKYYINWVLVATHTTYPPNDGNDIYANFWGYDGSGGGDCDFGMSADVIYSETIS